MLKITRYKCISLYGEHKVLFLSVAKYADLHRHMTEIHIVDCDKPFNLAFPGKFTNQS